MALLLDGEPQFLICPGGLILNTDKVSRVEGRVVAVIPRLGAVLSFFKSPPGLLLLLAAGILLYVYPSLIHALKRLRQSIR